jgi:hypothetical protein
MVHLLCNEFSHLFLTHRQQTTAVKEIGAGHLLNRTFNSQYGEISGYRRVTGESENNQ